MKLLDVNILVYAFRSDAPFHAQVKPWLDDLISRNEPFGASDLVMSGFLRILTLPKVYTPLAPSEAVIDFVKQLRSRPLFSPISPGKLHWEIFMTLCRQTQAKGNQIPDAFHAALAIEHDCEWVTVDRGFSRFKGLRLLNPLDLA